MDEWRMAVGIDRILNQTTPLIHDATTRSALWREQLVQSDQMFSSSCELAGYRYFLASPSLPNLKISWHLLEMVGGGASEILPTLRTKVSLSDAQCVLQV